MLDAYKFKKLKHLSDLSEENLPDNFIDTIAHDLGIKFNFEASGDLDLNILSTLQTIHHSDEWIIQGNRWW